MRNFFYDGFFPRLWHNSHGRFPSFLLSKASEAIARSIMRPGNQKAKKCVRSKQETASQQALLIHFRPSLRFRRLGLRLLARRRSRISPSNSNSEVSK
jgi:hypothetical protein